MRLIVLMSTKVPKAYSEHFQLIHSSPLTPEICIYRVPEEIAVLCTLTYGLQFCTQEELNSKREVPKWFHMDKVNEILHNIHK